MVNTMSDVPPETDADAFRDAGQAVRAAARKLDDQPRDHAALIDAARALVALIDDPAPSFDPEWEKIVALAGERTRDSAVEVRRLTGEMLLEMNRRPVTRRASRG